MLRFTIRDLLWLMTVVALMVGWLAEHRRAMLGEQAQQKLPEYRRAMIEVGSRFRKETGHGILIQIDDDVIFSDLDVKSSR
jgi:hypothetical protein